MSGQGHTGRDTGLEQGSRSLSFRAPRKIVLPKDCQSAEPVYGGGHHIDTNQHVNNAQYVDIARELLPEKFTIRELRTEYKKAAVLGDVMYPKIGKTAEGYVVSLQDAAGNVFANIWLAEKRGRMT